MDVAGTSRDAQSAVEALRIGAVDYVEKPLTRHELVEVVGRGLRTRTLDTRHRTLARRSGRIGDSSCCEALSLRGRDDSDLRLRPPHARRVAASTGRLVGRAEEHLWARRCVAAGLGGSQPADPGAEPSAGGGTA